MKKNILKLALFCAVFLSSLSVKAQTTAMDFTMMDCNNTGPHNLYSDLNAGKAVIIEFFMVSCGSCIVAGNALEAMKTNLVAQYPGKIKSYAFGFNNSYSCSTVLNWVNTNGYSSVPSDSGATQVAYYGGMGMPTIVIVGGLDHKLLGSPYVGFQNSDTTGMAANIRSYLNGPTGIEEQHNTIEKLNVFPNPAKNNVTVSLKSNVSNAISIQVMDITGKVAMSKSINEVSIGQVETKLDITNLPSGSYFLRVGNGIQVTNHKLNIIH